MAVEVKICGLTRPVDAIMAAEAGARWVGVVFAAGPRRLAPASARQVLRDVPPAVGRVGVFGPSSAETILRVVGSVGLDAAQLHFEAGADDVAGDLEQAGVSVWRVLRIEPARAPVWPVGMVGMVGDVVLVEPRVAGKVGGTGERVDLEMAGVFGRTVPAEIRFALAGGLTPETVREALRAAQPDIVDVSSGVEVRPGVKDPARIRRFIEEARDA